jgi:chemotaxis protein MotB
MARHRRKVFVDANNHDRWVVSYADFITLLFAFFVVMYAMSSVNEGKYKTLTESLGTAFSNNEQQPGRPAIPAKADPVLIKPPRVPLDVSFESNPLPEEHGVSEEKEWKLNPTPAKVESPKPEAQEKLLAAIKTAPDPLAVAFESATPSLQETQAKPEDTQNQTANSNQTEQTQESFLPSETSQLSLTDALKLPSQFIDQEQPNNPPPDTEEKRELSAEILKERSHLNQVSDQLEQALSASIADNLVAVKRNDYWIELEMNSELLFLSGDAALSKKAQPVLKEIVKVINTLPNAINVEGHTDNIPISNLKYPSNWDLSSARATSVVQELVKEGVDPTRLSAVGYGEFHPLGDNLTDEGRFKNRRVTMVLMSQAFARYGTNDAERAKLLNLRPTSETPPATMEP